jgi:hypothetical protein
MKKSFFASLLCAVTLGMASVMTSCGDNSPTSEARSLISEAEQKVPLKVSPCLGDIPSLQLQYAEAKSMVGDRMKQRMQEIKDKFKEGGSMEDAMRAYEKLNDEEKLLENEVEKVFLERIMASAKNLDGKPIACEADGKQYGAVTGKLVCAKDSSITAPLNVEFELTLASPYNSIVPYCSWKYVGAGDKELSAGAMPLKDISSVKNPSAMKTGDKFTVAFYVSVVKDEGMELEKIRFVP